MTNLASLAVVGTVSVATLWTVYTNAVTIGSILYSCLPPWESFSDYPRFQKAYKFFMIFAVKIASANIRSFLYPQIQATANVAGTATK